jgi:RNA polymerase sigma factor FliA
MPPSDRETLILHHLPLANEVASDIAARLPRFVGMADLIQDARVGLIKAAQDFDPQRACSFRTYARHRMRGEVLDGLRRADFLKRSLRRQVAAIDRARTKLRQALMREPDRAEIAKESELTIPQVQNAEIAEMEGSPLNSNTLEFLAERARPPKDQQPNEQPDEILIRENLAEYLNRAISDLPPRHRTVVLLRYAGDLTMRAIGERLGLSCGRVSQLHAQAIVKLRRILSSRSLQCHSSQKRKCASSASC